MRLLVPMGMQLPASPRLSSRDHLGLTGLSISAMSACCTTERNIELIEVPGSQRTTGSATRTMVRILVADEQALYRTGLRVVINAALPDADFVEAADLDGMMQVLMGADPIDLALVSLSLTKAADPLIIRDFKRASSATHYVIISADCSFDQILRYLAEGFHGFISKLQSEDEIVESVLEVLSGRLSVPQALMPSFAADRPQSRNTDAKRRWTLQQNQLGLTPRQKEVLALLADGLSNREIAQALHIAEPTTKIHVSALMRVLNVRNRTEAAILAGNLLRDIDTGPGGQNRPRRRKYRP